jgi:hypothetical protein
MAECETDTLLFTPKEFYFSTILSGGFIKLPLSSFMELIPDTPPKSFALSQDTEAGADMSIEYE